MMNLIQFPYPLEVIGGSYKYWDRYESKSISGFPPPFEMTGVSYSKSKDPKRGLTFRFRTLSRWLRVLTHYGEELKNEIGMFPYPPEVNGGSYRIPFIERLKEISVSVPSRGEWGVLLKKRRAMKTTKSKFPSSLEGEWGVLPSRKTTRRVLEEMFPYPRELNGGSYLLVSVVLQLMPFCFRTLPRWHWGFLQKMVWVRASNWIVSVPSRGDWGFLPIRLIHKCIQTIRCRTLAGWLGGLTSGAEANDQYVDKFP